MKYLDLGDTDQTADSIDCIFLTVYSSKLKVVNVSRAISQSALDQVNSTSLAISVSELLRVSIFIKIPRPYGPLLCAKYTSILFSYNFFFNVIILTDINNHRLLKQLKTEDQKRYKINN